MQDNDGKKIFALASCIAKRDTSATKNQLCQGNLVEGH